MTVGTSDLGESSRHGPSHVSNATLARLATVQAHLERPLALPESSCVPYLNGAVRSVPAVHAGTGSAVIRHPVDSMPSRTLTRERLVNVSTGQYPHCLASLSGRLEQAPPYTVDKPNTLKRQLRSY